MSDVRAGYKRTEVGVIPEEWEALPLGSLFFIKAAGDLDKLAFGAERTDLYPHPIFANALTNAGLYGFSRSANYAAPALTITARGDVGKAFFRGEPFSAIGRLLVLEPIDSIDARYAASCVNELVKFSLESTGVPQLTAPQVGRYSIPVPTVPEQQDIAQALEDADALITALEALIAKKRDIKQGAMQELLTGQRRLPGFLGGWTPAKVSSHSTVQVGFPFQSAFFSKEENGVRLIRNRDLKSDEDTVFYTGDYSKDFLVEAGQLLISMDGEFTLAIWKNVTSLLNQRVARLTPRTSDLGFMSYALAGVLGEIELATGSTTVKHLSHKDILAIEIDTPTLDEQRAIAAVLSEMDAEIAALEKKLVKARALKQGMMQVLLTGEVRLV